MRNGCVVAALLWAVASPVAAQQKPDFSGEWALNRKASTLSPGATAVGSGVLHIDHREPVFRYPASRGAPRRETLG